MKLRKWGKTRRDRGQESRDALTSNFTIFLSLCKQLWRQKSANVKLMRHNSNFFLWWLPAQGEKTVHISVRLDFWSTTCDPTATCLTSLLPRANCQIEITTSTWPFTIYNMSGKLSHYFNKNTLKASKSISIQYFNKCLCQQCVFLFMWYILQYIFFVPFMFITSSIVKHSYFTVLCWGRHQTKLWPPWSQL